MNPAAIALLALAMSTDAFAAAVAKGAALHRPRWREALRTGLIFGAIEAATPVIGWLLGMAARGWVQAWDHWIAFTLLGGLGLRMVLAGLSASTGDEEAAPRRQRHGFWLLVVTGIGTSIDALVAGAGLAFLGAPIVAAAAAIGFATFVMVSLGVMLGRVLGAIAGRRAELLGGLVLIGIGGFILFEHLSGRA